MSDYISRKDALDALGEEPDVWTGDDEYSKGMQDQWRYDKRAIESLPTADVVERKKGEWILQEDKTQKHYGWHFCSECGAWIGEPTNFCSECGVDMRGDKHGCFY